MRYSLSSITLYLILFLLIVWSCEGENHEVIDHIFFDGSIKLEDSTFYRITSPNGGESWQELSTQSIEWVSSGDVASSYEHLQLFYSLDGGLSWNQIGSNYTYNDSIFSWTLPQTYISNSTCRIKIRQYASPNIEDISDADFTIYATGGQSDLINIISANGGEEWQEQTSEQITWSTNGDIGGNQVYIGYSTDGGNSWNDVVDDGSGNSYEETNDPPYTDRWDETANNGSYSWTLPNFSDTLQNCIIGVWSAANTALYDMSDDYFTINCESNYYQILQPNGGEILGRGTHALIQWESGGDVGDVSLYYSEFGGDSWYSIDDYETNDGSFIWSVPTLQGDNSNCLIKIEDRDNPEWFDVSDATFTIAENPPPCDECGSEDFETGNFNNIPWWFDGDEPWTISTESYEGNYCARSGQIGSFETSELVINLNVENSGLISFYFKVSSENNWDKLKFYIDETFISEWSGEIDWEEFSYSVSQGNHEFRWIYYKDSGGDHGSDCVWIDNISFP